MYFLLVICTLLIFPAASIIAEAALSQHALPFITLAGKWLAFWAVGIRLCIAGARQAMQPRFTAEEIFRVHDPASLPIVREVGFANLSMGLLGICSVYRPGWTIPAALAGGLFYGLAGFGHVFQKGKNAKEYLAMVSDWYVFFALMAFLWSSLM